MNSHGIEISIGKGVEEMVREEMVHAFFLLFFYFFVFFII